MFLSKALFVYFSHFRLLNLWVYVLICLRCVFLSLPFDKKALGVCVACDIEIMLRCMLELCRVQWFNVRDGACLDNVNSDDNQ